MSFSLPQEKIIFSLENLSSVFLVFLGGWVVTKKEIIQLNNTSKKITNLELLSDYCGIKFKVHYEKLMVRSSGKKHISYKDHDLGKIHLYLMYQHMLSIRNWLK